MRHRVWLISAIAVIACSLFGAEPEETSEQKHYRGMLDAASVLPVEASADLTFALVDSGKASSPAAIRSLRRLYQRAGEAVRPTPVVFAPIQHKLDKAMQSEEVIDRLDLDGLSIKVRAIKRLVQFDKKAATTLADGDLFVYKLPDDVPCSSVLVPYPGHFYYPTLLKLFPDRFSELVQAMQTPQQIAAMSEAFSGLPILKVQPSQVSALDYAQFASRVSTILQHPVSDRVFMASDFKLGMLDSLLKVSRSEAVYGAQTSMIAQAWVNYALTQLKRTRCGDSRTREGQDLAVRVTFARIANLINDFGMPAVDLEAVKGGFHFSTDLYKVSDEGDPEATIGDLEALAEKVKLGGNDGVREQLILALQRYGARDKALLTKDLSHGDAVYRLASEAVMEFDLATKVDDSKVERLAVDLFFDDLESERLQSAEPAAFVLWMRFALDLLKHPSPVVAAEVRQRLTASKSAVVGTYWTINESVNLIPKYQSGLVSSPLKVLGVF